MITSTMLQLKISKTKKRLSNDAWLIRTIVLGLLALSVVMIFCFRALTVSGKYGAIAVDIPVLELSEKNLAESKNSNVKRYQITERSPVVVLTTSAFYVGSVRS